MDIKIRGYTLIELIVTFAIISIVLMLLIPTFFNLYYYTNDVICAYNRKSIERIYTTYLIDAEHHETMFKQFLDKQAQICPNDGDILFIDGKVNCSKHITEEVPELF